MAKTNGNTNGFTQDQLAQVSALIAESMRSLFPAAQPTAAPAPTPAAPVARSPRVTRVPAADASPRSGGAMINVRVENRGKDLALVISDWRTAGYESKTGRSTVVASAFWSEFEPGYKLHMQLIRNK